MTSTFDTLAAAGNDARRAVFGDALTHTAADGTETAFTGQLHEAPAKTDPATGGLVTTRTATCTVRAADVAAPVRGETITGPDGNTWAVAAARPIAGSAWELTLTDTAPEEKSARRDFRLRR